MVICTYVCHSDLVGEGIKMYVSDNFFQQSYYSQPPLQFVCLKFFIRHII